MYVNHFSLFWTQNVLPFSLIKSVFAVSLERLLTLDVSFQALRNTFQCNYWFKVWHYCEKTNEKSEQILYTIINAMLSKNMI